MKKNKLILLIIFMISSFSCSQTYKTLDSNEIKNAFTVNSSPTFKGYFYKGTDEKFHYFISKWDFEKDICFKLKKNDLNIVIPYGIEMNELRIDLFETENKFGSNNFYNLYIVE